MRPKSEQAIWQRDISMIVPNNYSQMYEPSIADLPFVEYVKVAFLRL